MLFNMSPRGQAKGSAGVTSKGAARKGVQGRLEPMLEDAQKQRALWPHCCHWLPRGWSASHMVCRPSSRPSLSSPQASRHSCPGPATLATLMGVHSSSQSPVILMPPSPWWSLQNSFQCVSYLFGLPLPFGNISCKYGCNKGQKWQGPNRNRRD